MIFPRVLIVSPEPYHPNSSSRCLASFFESWPRDCIAHFYTTDSMPEKCFCSNYFRITDFEMAKRNICFGTLGSIINTDKTEVSEKPVAVTRNNKIKSTLKRCFKKKTPFNQLLRSHLWKKKYWYNLKFRQWVDNFDPQAVFLDFGNDNRLSEIALTVAKEKNIPVVTFLPDDFYFKLKQTASPFRIIYNRKYKKSVYEVMAISSYCIFSCELMKMRYCQHFGCKGEVVYFVSGIAPDKNRKNINDFSYLGALEYGRWKSLIKIGNALKNISPDLHIDIYSNPPEVAIRSALDSCPAIRFHNPIPYHEVVRIMQNSRFVVHVEDFSAENIENTRYSLSTKIADCLSCGSCTFAFGPAEVGSMDYLLKNRCAVTCTDSAQLESVLRRALDGGDYIAQIMARAKEIAASNHNADTNSQKVIQIFKNATKL